MQIASQAVAFGTDLEEMKETLSLERTNTAMIKGDESHRSNLTSNFTIAEESSCAHSQESMDETPSRNRRRENSLALDIQLRNYTRMRTMRNLFANEQREKHKQRSKKKIKVHVELSTSSDNSVNQSEQKTKPTHRNIKSTKHRSRNSRPVGLGTSREKIIEILQNPRPSTRYSPPRSNLKNSAVPPVNFRDSGFSWQVSNSDFIMPSSEAPENEGFYYGAKHLTREKSFQQYLQAPTTTFTQWSSIQASEGASRRSRQRQLSFNDGSKSKHDKLADLILLSQSISSEKKWKRAQCSPPKNKKAIEGMDPSHNLLRGEANPKILKTMQSSEYSKNLLESISDQEQKVKHQQIIWKSIKRWPHGLIRKTRKLGKNQVISVTEDIRTSLILQSFSSKIPTEMFLKNQPSINQMSANKASVRFENHIHNSPKRSEPKANVTFDENSSLVKNRLTISSVDKASNDSKQVESTPLKKSLLGLRLSSSPPNTSKKGREYSVQRRMSGQILLRTPIQLRAQKTEEHSSSFKMISPSPKLGQDSIKSRESSRGLNNFRRFKTHKFKESTFSYGTEGAETFTSSSQGARSRGASSFASSIACSITKTRSRRNPLRLSSFDCSSFKSRRFKMINQYKVIDKNLGLGAQSRVVLAQNQSGQKFAIKIIKTNKSLYVKNGEECRSQVIQELETLREMSHKNIIRLHEFIERQEKEKFYLVMDYIKGGSVADKIKLSKTGLPVETARVYFRQLLSVIHYCHEVKNIAHRDIKPDNMMIGSDGSIVVCDFGISQSFQDENDLIHDSNGTIGFLSPEVFKSGNSKQVRCRQLDIWACGVTLYNMLTNAFPFEGKNIFQLQANILTEEAKLERIKDSQIKDLLGLILNKDPEKRIQIYELLQHPWVTNDGAERVSLDLVSASEYTQTDSLTEDIILSQEGIE